jgi:hypothetical protein
MFPFNTGACFWTQILRLTDLRTLHTFSFTYLWPKQKRKRNLRCICTLGLQRFSYPFFILPFFLFLTFSSKVKMSLMLNSATRHTDVLGSGSLTPRVLNFSIWWDKLLPSRFDRFNPKKITAVFIAQIRRALQPVLPEIEPRSPTAQSFTNWTIPAPPNILQLNFVASFSLVKLYLRFRGACCLCH